MRQTNQKRIFDLRKYCIDEKRKLENKAFFRKSKMREEKSLKKKEMKKYVKTYVNK